jgi:type IV pilus assembly protein PilP
MVQMIKIAKYALMMLVAMALSGVVSCSEKAPPQTTSAPMVKRKIDAPKASAAANPDTAAESQTQPKKQQEIAAVTPAGEQGKPAAEPTAGQETSSPLVQASLEIASSYDPEGRFDPFEPLFKEKAVAPQQVVAKKDKRQKRVPQTPLERVALSQLKLSAIMRTSRGNKAIVEDATGKGYVIAKGTYVGLNSGQVMVIDSDRVVVEEEIENVLGELTIQNTELKLQKPAGEL